MQVPIGGESDSVGERDSEDEVGPLMDNVGDVGSAVAVRGSARKSGGRPAEKTAETGRSDNVGETLVPNGAGRLSWRSGVPRIEIRGDSANSSARECDDPGWPGASESVGLKHTVFTLGDIEGRDESGDVTVSRCFSEEEPAPIMRRRNPLRFGLTVSGAAFSEVLDDVVGRLLGAVIPRREDRVSTEAMPRELGHPPDGSRGSTGALSGGVDAALRRAAARRSLSRARASSSEIRRWPKAPTTGAPGTAVKYEVSSRLGAGDLSKTPSPAGVDGDAVADSEDAAVE